MKKIIGLILYIISLLILILWGHSLWNFIFDTCKDCPTLLAVNPWWQNPYQLGFIICSPIIAIILFIIGKKFRK